MTVPATSRRAGPFLGNGSTTAFPFTFKTTDATEVQVVKLVSGIETALVKDSDYTVTLNVDQDATPGGTITYPIVGGPLATGETLTIAGQVPYSQDTDLPTGGKYAALVVENALDRIVAQVQQLAEENGRSLRLPLSSASASTELPAPEANKFIGWNETADALQNIDPTTLATVVAFGTANYLDTVGDGATTAFTLPSNPGALANLDVAVGGVTQRPVADYNWGGGTTLTFTSAPANGVTVFARYLQALPQGTSDAGATTFSYAASYSAGTIGKWLKDLALSTGASFIGWIQSGASAVTRTVQDKLRELHPSPEDFGSISAANTAAEKSTVRLGGAYSYAPMTLGQVSWLGRGWTSDPAIDAGSVVRKTANGTQLIMGGDDTSLEALQFDGKKSSLFTGDGVQVAATRQSIVNVSSVNQQGVGFRFGGAGATGVFNANIWTAIRPIALANAGDGIFVHHSGGTATAQFPNGTPDVNAGVMLGCDSRNNGGIGLHLQNAIDNVYIGTVCQTNTGKGVVLEADAKSNVLIHPYAEANNGGGAGYGDEGDILPGALANIVWGHRLTGAGSGSGWADRTAPGKNTIFGFDYQVGSSGTGEFVWRSKFNLWNRKEDGVSTTVDFDFWLDTNPINVCSFKGFKTGASGGGVTVYTKIDGGALAPAYQGDQLQRLRCFSGFSQKRVSPAYGAVITIDASTASSFEVTANNGTAFTVSDFTNPLDGDNRTLTIRNASGGALGAITWGASFKMSAWVSPATGNSRSITFRYNGTNWVEIGRTPADVPN